MKNRKNRNEEIIEHTLDAIYKDWFDLDYSSKKLRKLLWKHFIEIDKEFLKIKKQKKQNEGN
jgi:hypothetical protein